MSHCAYCQATVSGYRDNHWENVQENLWACKDCLEKIAVELLKSGDEQYVAPAIRKVLLEKYPELKKRAEAIHKGADNA